MADSAAGNNGNGNGNGNGNCSTKDATYEYGANVHVSAHPVLSHKITILRSSTTRPEVFRAVLREVTYHLGYEATGSLTTKPVAISVPVGKSDHMDCDGHKLKERVAMIPILRSGLGMVDSMLELIPNAAIHHIGIYRVVGQEPVQYYNKLPKKCDADVVYILDPVIATSATVISVITLMKKWGVKHINVIAVIGSREGLKQLTEAHPDVRLTVGTVDETLENGIILPGLGDAGDRQFGTASVSVDDEESLLHPSKRKRIQSKEE